MLPDEDEARCCHCGRDDVPLAQSWSLYSDDGPGDPGPAVLEWWCDWCFAMTNGDVCASPFCENGPAPGSDYCDEHGVERAIDEAIRRGSLPPEYATSPVRGVPGSSVSPAATSAIAAAGTATGSTRMTPAWVEPVAPYDQDREG